VPNTPVTTTQLQRETATERTWPLGVGLHTHQQEGHSRADRNVGQPFQHTWLIYGVFLVGLCAACEWYMC